jgi:hypothetical protein
MIKALTRVGDRLLGVLLPGTEAGACCSCIGAVCGCRSHKQYALNCAGICQPNGKSC